MVEARLHAPSCQTAGESGTRSQTGCRTGNGRESHVGRSRAGIKNREGKSRLEDRHARNTPSAQQSSLQSSCMIEERNVLEIANRQSVPAIKISQTARAFQVELIV